MSSVTLKKEYCGSAAGSVETGVLIGKIPGEPNGYELIMNGPQAPGWVGRLATGLARQRTGIIRGEAEKVTASAWRSRFELKSAPFAPNPLTFDYAALAAAETPLPSAGQKIALLDFSMHSSTQGDGTLTVEVTGLDRLGFLGDLLDHFSMRCLFPVKMTIETVAEKAVDRFWLRGIGGSRPSESITAAIRENLERLLVDKA